MCQSIAGRFGRVVASLAVDRRLGEQAGGTKLGQQAVQVALAEVVGGKQLRHGERPAVVEVDEQAQRALVGTAKDSADRSGTARAAVSSGDSPLTASRSSFGRCCCSPVSVSTRQMRSGTVVRRCRRRPARRRLFVADRAG